MLSNTRVAHTGNAGEAWAAPRPATAGEAWAAPLPATGARLGPRPYRARRPYMGPRWLSWCAPRRAGGGRRGRGRRSGSGRRGRRWSTRHPASCHGSAAPCCPMRCLARHFCAALTPACAVLVSGRSAISCRGARGPPGGCGQLEPIRQRLLLGDALISQLRFAVAQFGDLVRARGLTHGATGSPGGFGLSQVRDRRARVERGQLARLLQTGAGFDQVGIGDQHVTFDAPAGEQRN